MGEREMGAATTWRVYDQAMVDRLITETERLRERDAAAQTLIGVLRLALIEKGDLRGGPDFSLYRKYLATGIPVREALGGPSDNTGEPQP